AAARPPAPPPATITSKCSVIASGMGAFFFYDAHETAEHRKLGSSHFGAGLDLEAARGGALEERRDGRRCDHIADQPISRHVIDDITADRDRVCLSHPDRGCVDDEIESLPF